MVLRGMWIFHPYLMFDMKKIFIVLFILISMAATAQNVMRMAPASGTNTYAAAFNPPLTSFNVSTLYVVTFTNANTSTTVTLNPDGIVAATAVKDNAGNDPAVGAIVAGGTYVLRYNGTNLRITGTAILTLTNLPNLTIQSNDYVTLDVANDLDIVVGADFKINGVSPTSGQFLGNVDGNPVWATPPGTGGGAGIDNVMDINTTQAGTVTTGEDELYSFVVDKDSIDDDEDVLHARFSGTLAGNGNTKTIKVYWGDDFIVNFSGTFTSTWSINCEIIRVSSTAQQSNCAIVGASSGITHSSVVIDLDQNLSSDVEISLTGEGTATNDIVFETATIFRNTGGGGGGGAGDLSLTDFVTSETPSGTVDGVNDDFTLAFTPAGGVHIYVNGLLQEVGGGNDYTRTGPNITFTTPPAIGSIILASYIK